MFKIQALLASGTHGRKLKPSLIVTRHFGEPLMNGVYKLITIIGNQGRHYLKFTPAERSMSFKEEGREITERFLRKTERYSVIVIFKKRQFSSSEYKKSSCIQTFNL